MKRIMLLAMCGTAMAAAAQNPVFDNPDNRGGWGIRASLDISVPGKFRNPATDFSIGMYSNGAGFSAGAFYSLPLVANLYFEPGLSFFVDTEKYDDLYVSNGDAISDKEVNGSVTRVGFRVPLIFGYRFDIWENGGISVLTGPQADIGVYGEHTKELVDNGLDKDYYDENNRFNLMWGVGAAVHFGRFSVSGMYNWGLLDLNKDKNITFHDNLATVTLGWRF